MQTNFLLGSILLTNEAHLALQRLPYDLLARHAINEHGLVTVSEHRRNQNSMKTIGPIRSRYLLDPTSRRQKYIVVETDKTWSSTLISIE